MFFPHNTEYILRSYQHCIIRRGMIYTNDMKERSGMFHTQISEALFREIKPTHPNFLLTVHQTLTFLTEQSRRS